MQKNSFLEDVSPWSNHRVLMWEALELTKESSKPVVEFGAGDGSTKFLRQYCLSNNREFFSYESNAEWAEKCGSIHVDNWNKDSIYFPMSVVLIDHAPGEHRHEAIAILKDLADIIVVHDSEPAATGYMLDKIWHLFNFRYDLQSEGAWATMLSNKIDISTLII